jgi:hypothetical protein
MKRQIVSLIGIMALLAALPLAGGQDSPVDRASVAFDDPGKPGRVEVSLIYGGITVTGYSGKEVTVEARIKESLVDEPEEINKKAEGLKLIRINTTGLRLEKDGNTIEIGANSWKQAVDLNIRVPFNSSLELHTTGHGAIIVENVSGVVEANNSNGDITLSNLSGAALASTANGHITASFKSIDPDQPMSFSSWNGDIDVTIPAATKATFKMNSARGNIYSDFDIKMIPKPEGEEEVETPKLSTGVAIPKLNASTRARTFERAITRARNAGSIGVLAGSQLVIGGDYVYGTINGGGPVFHFKNFMGDILIRKAK